MQQTIPPLGSLLRQEGSDTCVQGTNDDAQVSKFSCARAGYFKDDFIQFFVRRSSRRSPLINRGYFTRYAALRALLDLFLRLTTASTPEQQQQQEPEAAPCTTPASQQQPSAPSAGLSACGGGSRCQVISLGAGFDTTWWQLAAQGRHPRGAPYIELDFKEVTQRKAAVIASQPKLKEIIERCHQAEAAAAAGAGSGVVIDAPAGRVLSAPYSLLPVDLRDLAGLEAALQSAGWDPSAPTYVLSECVLVYMDPAASSGLLSWLSSRLDTAAVVVYEQIKPHDAFGRQMVSNLESRGCPLRGLPTTPTLEAHCRRLTGCGWQRAAAWDMDTVYRDHLDPADKARAESLEIFDELEEWHMIQEHYSISVGVNDRGGSGLLDAFGFSGGSSSAGGRGYAAMPAASSPPSAAAAAEGGSGASAQSQQLQQPHCGRSGSPVPQRQQHHGATASQPRPPPPVFYAS